MVLLNVNYLRGIIPHVCIHVLRIIYCKRCGELVALIELFGL